MELGAYLKQKRMKLQEFADLTGYSLTQIKRVKLGYTYPSIRLVRRIEEITEGRVTRYELLRGYDERIKRV